MPPKIVIEHLEPDYFEWCQYEYERIAKFIKSHDSTLLITNFSHPSFADNVECRKQPCASLLPQNRVCLLDSEAPLTLSPEDAANFDYFLLGGILGNVDEFDFDRTSILREQGFARRNLGSMQMTTDTAAIVTSLIVHQGMAFDAIQFVDRPEFSLANDCKEKLIMNFRYIAKPDGTADIDPKILSLAMDDREFCLDDLE